MKKNNKNKLCFDEEMDKEIKKFFDYCDKMFEDWRNSGKVKQNEINDKTI